MEFSVNNEESIVSKSSDEMKKFNDVENDGYLGRNVACMAVKLVVTPHKDVN